MIKAAIYARQSSGDEIESASIEHQIAVCKEIAQKNGYKVIAIEKDANISGRTYPLAESAIKFSENDVIYKKYISKTEKRKRLPLRHNSTPIIQC